MDPTVVIPWGFALLFLVALVAVLVFYDRQRNLTLRFRENANAFRDNATEAISLSHESHELAESMAHHLESAIDRNLVLHRRIDVYHSEFVRVLDQYIGESLRGDIIENLSRRLAQHPMPDADTESELDIDEPIPGQDASTGFVPAYPDADPPYDVTATTTGRFSAAS